MSKEFDRIVEFLKNDADYLENPSGFVLYVSVEPYDRKNPDHHIHEDYEDDTNDFEDDNDYDDIDDEDCDDDDIELEYKYSCEGDYDDEDYESIPISHCTHVVRCVQAWAYTGSDYKPTSELMQIVDGYQLNIVLTDSDIKVIRGDDEPEFNGESGDAKEWCKEYSGEFYENIDILNKIVLECTNNEEEDDGDNE